MVDVDVDAFVFLDRLQHRLACVRPTVAGDTPENLHAANTIVLNIDPPIGAFDPDRLDVGGMIPLVHEKSPRPSENDRGPPFKESPGWLAGRQRAQFF
jgi:hypothetical protein